MERQIAEWSAAYTAGELTERLHSTGIAAFPSLSAAQLLNDPHLAARAAFPAATHPDKGTQRAVAPPCRFGATPAAPLRWTPELGADNRAVFCGLPGMDEFELVALQEARIIW